MDRRPHDEPRRWLDEPGNVTRIFYTLVAVLAGWTVADLFYDKHGHFGFENWFGFHALYGFVGSVFLVLAAKGLRRILMRDEEYYDD